MTKTQHSSTHAKGQTMPTATIKFVRPTTAPLATAAPTAEAAAEYTLRTDWPTQFMQVGDTPVVYLRLENSRARTFRLLLGPVFGASQDSGLFRSDVSTESIPK